MVASDHSFIAAVRWATRDEHEWPSMKKHRKHLLPRGRSLENRFYVSMIISSIFLGFLWFHIWSVIRFDSDAKKRKESNSNSKKRAGIVDPKLSWADSRERGSSAHRIEAILSVSRRFSMIPGDSSESYWVTRLLNFQNRSLRFHWIKLIPNMIPKNLSTSYWSWIDSKYGNNIFRYKRPKRAVSESPVWPHVSNHIFLYKFMRTRVGSPFTDIGNAPQLNFTQQLSTRRYKHSNR